MDKSLVTKKQRVHIIVSAMRMGTKEMPITAAQAIVNEFGNDPFLVLVSCLLSLRTKDAVSLAASRRLFHLAKKPHDLVRLSLSLIQNTIYPTGFYRKKSQQLIAVSQYLIDHFDGKVPSHEQELLSLPGVGRKTMNLVRGIAFGIPAICVDTHVHRIANRLGLVNTTTPEATEIALKDIVPEAMWVEFNTLLVMWGQNICTPLSPYCSTCPLASVCQQKGVTIHR